MLKKLLGATFFFSFFFLPGGGTHIHFSQWGKHLISSHLIATKKTIQWKHTVQSYRPVDRNLACKWWPILSQSEWERRQGKRDLICSTITFYILNKTNMQWRQTLLAMWV